MTRKVNIILEATIKFVDDLEGLAYLQVPSFSHSCDVPFSHRVLWNAIKYCRIPNYMLIYETDEILSIHKPNKKTISREINILIRSNYSNKDQNQDLCE